MRAEHTGDTLHIRNRQTAPHADTHETIVAEHCEMFRYSQIMYNNLRKFLPSLRSKGLCRAEAQIPRQRARHRDTPWEWLDSHCVRWIHHGTGWDDAPQAALKGRI